jgi:septal ring factor EnvC (AmiA/AmiB activator)
MTPMRRRARRLVSLSLAAPLLALPLLASSSSSAGAPRADPRERELTQIRAEIAGLEGRLEREKRERTGLTGELQATDIELRLEAERLAEAVAARDLAVTRVAASERAVAALEAALAAARVDLGRRLTGLYRLGRQGYLRLFLSLRPDAQLLPSIRLMRYLARRDRATIDRYTGDRERLASERDRLREARAEGERWILQERSRRAELVRLRDRQSAFLASAEREHQVLIVRAGELAVREHKLAGMVDLLYGRNPQAVAGKPMQAFRGVLDWPARGRVTAGFGPLLDPRYRTRVPHNGVDIATAPGGEVRAVFPGKVLYAAPFEGYGPTVVLFHAGRVLTLYAGLSEARVQREDVVPLGHVVGLASDKLYFEIRVENHPENPSSWLRP